LGKNRNIPPVPLDEDWLTYLEPRSTPEQNLITAVLERAVCDLLGHDKDLKRRSINWFMCDEPYTEFSFVWCLAVLNLENAASRIRKKIFTLEEFPKTRRRM